MCLVRTCSSLSTCNNRFGRLDERDDERQDLDSKNRIYRSKSDDAKSAQSILATARYGRADTSAERKDERYRHRTSDDGTAIPRKAQSDTQVLKAPSSGVGNR